MYVIIWIKINYVKLSALQTVSFFILWLCQIFRIANSIIFIYELCQIFSTLKIVSFLFSQIFSITK